MRVSEPVTRLSVVLTGDRPYLGWLALTPDGRTLVYRVGREGSNQLVARSMDRLEATPLDGTGGGFDPFFSPDGRWMGFVGNRRLRKIRLAGGGYEELCELGVGMNGGTWGADGTIVFAPQDGPGLMRISADGGTPARLTTTPPNERAHRNPQFLPDAKGLLFTVTTTETASYDQARIEVLELATGARRVVLEGVRWARYVPPGHLVFARAGRLFATSFDPLRYQVIGDPVALAGDVSMEGFTVHAAVSDGGSLAYVPASLPPESTRRLVWINRKGEVEPVRNEPGYFLSPRVSPDGRRVAFIEQRPSNTLSVYDLDRATSTRVAATGDVISPAWLPDGRTLLYSRSQPQNDLASTAIDNSLDRSLFRSPDALEPESVSPDGRLVITTMISLTTRSDLWVVPLDSSDKPWALLQSPGEEYGARISPDGKWFAYASNEAGLGRHEVYVRPLARSGGRHQISTDGGNAVAWAASGRELFYRQRDRLMAVDIRLGSTFSAGPPKALFTLSGRYREGFDVSPDGQRFLFVQEIEKPVAQVNIVLNWPGDLPHHPPAKWQIECAPI